jgi:membrane associated rhomboid family serine protease
VIFPLSHERMTARRWPIVTTIIFFACVLVQIALSRADASGGGARDEAVEKVVEYFAQHPYLDVPPDAVAMLDPETIAAAHALSGAVGAPDDDTRHVEQAELDRLIASVKAQPDDDPLRRFGYVPAEGNWRGLLTYPFLHAGWLHLAGNMWFLFFCGMTLEDRWGRVVFPLFYVAGGAFAALVHGWVHPHDTLPLVGASGAIAACMGAFTVAFARTQVRFAWLLALRPRTFTAPAYAVLPVWAGFEVVSAFVFPGDGTAHWAHVGGFAFGLVVGFALHKTGLDRRLDDAVEVAAVLGGDPRIDEARRLLGLGRAAEASAMLEGLLIERPDSAVVHEAMAEVAARLGDAQRAATARQRAATLRGSQD